MSWAERRKLKLLLIWAASGVMGAAIVLLASRLPAAWFGGLSASEGVDGLEEKLGLFGFVARFGPTRSLIAAHPNATIAVFGFIAIGGLMGLTRRQWLHDNFFASFNDDVLFAINAIDRPDQDRKDGNFLVLPWTPGGPGSRREAWETLQTWVWRGVPRSRILPGQGAREPLTMAFLTGRSGSGKSRLAYQLALELEGRLDTGEPVQRASFGAWLRRVVWCLDIRPGDPWDAGLLQRRPSLGWSGFVADLKTWLPRRATLLILDDPPNKVLREVWAALTQTSKTYHHPVRLLVTNQTVTKDSGFAWSDRLGCWTFEDGPADPPPVRLPQSAWFTPEETAQLAMKCAVIEHGPATITLEKALRETLHERTRGNPLLVQLMLEQVAEHQTFIGVSDETILALRANKILTALAAQDIVATDQLAMIAVATLAGGAGRGSLRTVLQAGVDLPTDDRLRSCFPSEPLALTANHELEIPPIRPDLVADAFVEQVLLKIGQGRAPELARAAFRLAPATLLRSLRRPRPPGSVMGQALASVRPEDVQGLDPVDYALALADVAVIGQPFEWPATTAQSRQAALEATEAMVARLDGAQATRFCAEFAQLVEIPPLERSSRQLRATSALRIFELSAARANNAGGYQAWLGVLQGAARWGLNGRHYQLSGEPLSRVAAACASDKIAAENLWRSAWAARELLDESLIPVAAALADNAPSGPRAIVFRALHAMVSRAPERTADIVQGMIDILASGSDQIAADGPFAPDIAEASLHETIAWSEHDGEEALLRTRAAADRVCAIAHLRSGDRALGRMATAAALAVAKAAERFSSGEEADVARAAADLALAIADQFPEDAEICCLAAAALQVTAHTYARQPPGRAAVETAFAADQTASLLARFPRDPKIAEQAVLARAHHAFSINRFPHGAHAEEVSKVARQAETMSSAFGSDPQVQSATATALRYEAFAWAERPDGAGAEMITRPAEALAAIQKALPECVYIADEAAGLWNSYASAWAQRPGGQFAGAARKAADVTEAIAAQFHDYPSVQDSVLIARSQEAAAWGSQPDGKGAAQASVAAGKAMAVLETYPQTGQFAGWVAQALHWEVDAWRRQPGGGELAAVAAARRLYSLGDLHPNDTAVHRRIETVRTLLSGDPSPTR